MDEDIDSQIRNVVEALEEINRRLVSPSTSNSYLSVKHIVGTEVRISGNKEGLLLFAAEIANLTNSQLGTHYHYDEHGMIDESDVPIVVSKCSAPWENQ